MQVTAALAVRLVLVIMGFADEHLLQLLRHSSSIINGVAARYTEMRCVSICEG